MKQKINLILILGLVLLLLAGCTERAGEAYKKPNDDKLAKELEKSGQKQDEPIPVSNDPMLQGLPQERQLELQQELLQIEEDIKEKGGLWTAGHTSKSILSEDEKHELLGLLTSEEKLPLVSSDIRPKLNLATPLPDNFDWRNQHGVDYITDVKDQANCGSCWAFAAIAALEGHINVYYNNPGIEADLSEQDLVSCFHGSGCSGAYDYEIEEIFSNYYQNTGISYEDCFPYTATNDDCANKCSTWADSVWKTVSYVRPVLDPDELKRTLIAYGPVEVGMTVYNDFFSYESGIYSPTTDALAGYHAVTIVGYGVYDGQEYWIVKNSWGPEWGENGYFKITFGVCEIDSWFAFAADTPMSPTIEPVRCTDNDKDGYCYWGVGKMPEVCPYEKPSDRPIVQGAVVDTEASCCPANCEVEPDCDDSDNSIFENCGISTEQLETLNVNSEPSGATVFVIDQTTENYVIRGTTPATINLNSGYRTLRITKEDYVDEILSLNIAENQTLNVSVSLKLAPKISRPMNKDIYRLGDVIHILGTAVGPDFQSYSIEYKEDSTDWQTAGITLIDDGLTEINDDILAVWDTSSISDTGYCDLRLTVNYNSNEESVYIYQLYFDSNLKQGWPQRIDYYFYDGSTEFITTSELYTVVPRAGENSESIKVVTRDEILKLTAPDSYYYWAGLLEPVVSDINNDGFKEIIVLKGAYPPELLVYKYDGTLLWSRPFGEGGVAGGNLHIPLVADLDNDGYDEIIAYNIERNLYTASLHAFNHDGSLLWTAIVPEDFHPSILMADLDLDGNKEIVVKGNDYSIEKMIILNNQGDIISQWNLPDKSWVGTIDPSPAVGNFDDDPELEIVTADPSENAGYDWVNEKYINEGAIYVYNLDGSVLEGWPVYTKGIILSSPVVGDINNDGELEIVVGLMYEDDNTCDFPCEEFGGVYAFDKHGNIMPGWPIEKGWNFWSTPSLADYDDDEYLEIVTSRLGGYTYLINHLGVISSGWPKLAIWNDYYSSLRGDITGNGVPDIITTAGRVYAWDVDGNLIETYPKVTETDAQAPAVIADIDNDGKIEIVASSDWDFDYVRGDFKDRGSIYVWETDVAYNPSTMHWPTFMHDNQHTGYYPKSCGLTLGGNCVYGLGLGKGEYCKDGKIIYACQTCGCSAGYTCMRDGTCVIPKPGTGSPVFAKPVPIVGTE